MPCPPRGKGDESLLRTVTWRYESQSENLLVTIFRANRVFTDGFEGIGDKQD